MVREDWMNLNGLWQFEIDRGDSGLERGLLHRELSGTILVPFAPESALSGIEDVDFMDAVWYRRTVEIPQEWNDRELRLHFGAVDHDTTVWVNDREVLRHRGGFTSFTAEFGTAARLGPIATIVVRARDRKAAVQARGKQATFHGNSHAVYTRTTGIWQTVWLEPVPTTSIRRVHVTPDLANGAFQLRVPVTGPTRGSQIRVTVTERFDADAMRAVGDIVANKIVRADLDMTPSLIIDIPEARLRTWSPGDPHLYGLVVEIVDPNGDVSDTVYSYAGLRSIAIDGMAVRINGDAVFQRLVLDQGYWPQSLMTAPSDAALIADIELAMDAGFNGARLHQKVFEERYLFHADRLGYLVWGEFGDWGVSGQGPEGNNQQPNASFVAQWIEALERDISHPSIIGWCPMNETHQVLTDEITALDDVTRAMFLATKAADPTRPVLDASGYSHRVLESDVWDSHSYEQDPAIFAAEQSGLDSGEPFNNVSWIGSKAMSVPYRGQPYFVSEFGGIWWVSDSAGSDGIDRTESWGYGVPPASEEEFYERFERLVAVLSENPRMFGYCYTQLTDVFQEQNGIYRFDRSTKLRIARIREVQRRPAAIERSSHAALAGEPQTRWS